MTEEQRTRYFCDAHPHLFAQQECSNCYRGMCYTCKHDNERLCPICLKNSFFDGDQSEIFSQAKSMGIGGLFGIAIYTFSQYIDAPTMFASSFVFWQSLFAFFIGASIVGAFYLYKDGDILESIQKVPFIGFKLMLAVLVSSVIACVPVFSLGFKLVKISRQQMRFSKTTNRNNLTEL